MRSLPYKVILEGKIYSFTYQYDFKRMEVDVLIIHVKDVF
jgi:hypothetical protein